MAHRTLSRSAFHRLTVADVTTLCEDAVAVTFDVPDALADQYAFRPGQALTVRRAVGGREERRHYSICSPSGAPPRIGVREVPDGACSSWLVHDVRPGDEVDVGPPTGTFTPDVDVANRHVLIAAGSGITPILSIASSVLANPDSTVTLLYGNRRSSTVMFADDLADLKDRYPTRLELVHVLSREPREVELFSGRIDAEKLTAMLRLLDPDRVDHWWVCGPYGMVVDAHLVLSGIGVPKERIHQELFFVEDDPPEPVSHKDPDIAGASSQVTVMLDGRSTTTQLSRATPILDGAQAVRPDLPFACKGGVCGTCRARLVEGDVDMRRNFALEDSELSEGFILTCQSRPVSDEVTVDYDA